MLYIKSRVSRSYIIVLVIIAVGLAHAKENEKWFPTKEEQPHVGNFALPISQQPGPLVSFGQNIPDKGVLQMFAYGNQYKGTRHSYSEVIPSILYGITDRLSIFVEVPIAVKFRYEDALSRGLTDVIVQLEGVVYIHETTTTVNEITAVGNITLPTGSFNTDPEKSFGSPTFFLGFTASHSAQKWYYFTSMGGQITTVHKNTKIGNRFLYQFGLGRNIAYKEDKWILNWLVELNGIYEQYTRIAEVKQRSSGGNTLLLGPSLWFSTEKLIIQGGISAVVAEHLFGNQLKNTYLLSAYAGWTF